MLQEEIHKLAIYNQPQKYIGYWRSNMYNICDEFPFPFPSFMQLEQERIVDKTIQILKKYGVVVSYFGFSQCRLCNLKRNGHSEYFISYKNITYVIPFGYFHYLMEHNVKIDSVLLEIVDYYSQCT
jgi:hypothetical protein